MPNARDEVMRLIDKSQAALLRNENRVVRDILVAYEQARKELMAEIVDAYGRIGENPEAAAIRRLANDVTLVQAINRRIAALEQRFATILDAALRGVVDDAGSSVLAEIRVLAQALGLDVFTLSLGTAMEVAIIPAMEQIPGLMAQVKAGLLSEMRIGLARGDRMRELAQRLLGKNESVFARGRTSAELMVRRAVIQANNQARLLWLEQAQEQVPGLQKQAVAAIKSNTTQTCLRVHGQVKKIDEPFELTGEPKFDRRMMSPPFHWNCRTSSAPYHPVFEQGSNITTASMREDARKELARR